MKKVQKEYEPAGKLCRYSFTHAHMLDSRLRRIFQNPEKILGGYITPGMTAIDLGCGPGTFTRTMAELAGENGTVIGCDIQDEMLKFAESRCRKKGPESRIIWHRSSQETTGIKEKADFILSFYMVHEVSDQESFLREIFEILKPGGKYLIAEPTSHVTEDAFEKTIKSATEAGFTVEKQPKILFSRAVMLSGREEE